MTSAPNLLVVLLDTARADFLSPYGAPEAVTPFIGSMARQGGYAPSMFSTSNWTLPSHASLLSGLLPRSLGVAGGSGDRAEFLARSAAALRARESRLLAPFLRERGFACRAISTNPWIRRAAGFDLGFEELVEVEPARSRGGSALATRARWWRCRDDDGAREAARLVDGWIRGTAGPFFWFVNLMECHSPYLPPRPYAPAGPVKRWRAAGDAIRYLNPIGQLQVGVGEAPLSPGAVRRLRDFYARAIRSMDDWLAGVAERLDAAGMLEDTLIVVLSDHGENLGEGHLVGHTMSLDQRLLHVPLVWRGPVGLAPAADRPGSLVELPGMIAEALGFERHPWAGDPASAVAIAQNDGLGQDEARREVARRRGVPPAATEILNRPMDSAFDGRFKLVRRGGSRALYDVAADPLETTDVLAAHPDDAARLEAALASADGRPPGDRSDAEAPADGPVDEAEAAEIERHLETLGYL